MTEKRAPHNTKQKVEDDPFPILAEAMVDSLSGNSPSAAIERQEARGQHSFVQSTTLPTRHMDGEHKVKDVLEAAGVKFGEVVEGDDLFQYVELPEGWEKKPTDHSMWSHLVDDKGRVRASIFYKAAFYDRGAHINLERRYSCGLNYERCQTHNESLAEARDGGGVIFSTKPVARPDGYENYQPLENAAEKEVKDWLNEHFPDWTDPGAYWD